MAYEMGGRADKYGNRFEYNWVVCKLLDVIEEKLACVILEALGKDESGVDLWVIDNDGNKEGQQCKGRDGSEEHWTFASINEKGLWNIWKRQLDRNDNISVSLVSPLAFTLLEDITVRARNNMGNSNEFYKHQINNSGEKTKKLFNNVCRTIGIDPNKEEGCEKIFSYFKRIYYRQCPDSELKNYCLSRIDRLFNENPETVYSLMIDYILTQDIYGKEITAYLLNNYFETQEISFRNLANDNRILPRIKELNEEYKYAFNLFPSGMIFREESKLCYEYIKQGASIIIHGQAGAGKSGCTTNIINFCEQESIPYLAIKLDKRIPIDNTKTWSNTMELPASISHCIDSISKNRNAVLILDQLDALRWTQAHSGIALTVCMQLIREINAVNYERQHKISLIFVCRSYDLENDSGIKSLFEKDDENKWKKVAINLLNDTEIKQVVGSAFDGLSEKNRKLLRVASNLYIWGKLDGTQDNEKIEATYHLVKAWWNQIVGNANLNNLETDKIEKIKSGMVTFCDNRGQIAVPIVVAKIPHDYKVFLISNGFLIESNSKVSFSHQSILDCFLAEQMIQKYYDGKILKEIIGSINRQTPGRRYQVQIFLQQLAEMSEEDFLEIGKELLKRTDIRYSFKYVFLEVLSQVNSPGIFTLEFVMSLLERDEWKIPLINTVIRGKKAYITYLIKNGILAKWMDNDDQDTVIDLCASLAPNYDETVIVEFIKNYILKDEVNKNWILCFYRGINEDPEEFFELRLEFYKKHPEMLGNFINLTNILLNCEIRTVRILALMLELKIKKYGETIYKYVEKHTIDNNKVSIHNYMTVLDTLVPFLPKNNSCYYYSDWYAGGFGKNNLERACVLIIKAANREFIKLEPERFLKYYEFGFGKGNDLYNEIILDAIQYINSKYADYVINYLQTDIFRNCFEKSSNKGNELFYTKKIVNKFSKVCDENILRKFEDSVIHYISPQAKDRLRRRIEQNREQKINANQRVYWNFWGDFQYEILSSIDVKRRSVQTNQLLIVLMRKFVGKNSIYDHSYDGRSYSVVSPVSGKKLSSKTWMKIIQNPKIKDIGKSKWFKDKRLCIETSLEEFSISFRRFVEENPNEIADLFLDEENTIRERFVDDLFLGISLSNKIEEISSNKIESLIRKFGYNYASYRAHYICEIIEKKSEVNWSDHTLACIEDIALNHNIPELDNPVIVSSDDKKVETVQMIESNALNCVRGSAIRVIGELIKNNADYYLRFKDCISKLIDDVNPIINYAVLWVLCPIYDIEKTWAVEKIMLLFEKNYKMIGFDNSRWIFFHCYSEYKTTIVDAVNKASKTKDERLLQVSGYSIIELYMVYDEYNDLLNIYEHAEKVLRRYMLEMLITYFEIDKYKSKAKAVLLKVIDGKNDIDSDFIWGRLFRNEMLDVKDDSDLIKKILYSNINKRILVDFAEFILKQGNLKDYSDLIIESGHAILDRNQIATNQLWELEDEIPKLIIDLYDITSVSGLEKDKNIACECLNIWDKMYECNIGMARLLTNQIMKM